MKVLAPLTEQALRGNFMTNIFFSLKNLNMLQNVTKFRIRYRGLNVCVATLIIFSNFLIIYPVYAEPSYDWSGAYAGVTVGRADGKLEEGGGSTNRSGNMQGLFLGYNWKITDDLISGLEFSKLIGAVYGKDPLYPNNKIMNYEEITAKFGKATGSTLIYASAGLITGKVRPHGYDILGDANFSGTSFGLGLDYAVNDKLFLGIKATRRNNQSQNFEKQISGVTYYSGGYTNMMELRLGYKF